VRVLIVGQDPTHAGHPVGLSFSVAPEVKRLPPSLVNIFREYGDDLGFPPPGSGTSPVDRRGVLLLNRVLPSRQANPGRTGARDGNR